MPERDNRTGVHIFRGYFADPTLELVDLERELGTMPEEPERGQLIPLVLRVYAWYHLIEELNWQPLTITDAQERARRRRRRRKAAESHHRLVTSLTEDDLPASREAAARLAHELQHVWEMVRESLYTPHP